MKELILDTSIVLRNPSVLSKRFRDVKVVIPDIVEREIEFVATKRRDTAELPKLIRDSIKKKLVSVERAPAGFEGEQKTNSLTLADALIFEFVQHVQSQKRDFAFVTSDKELVTLCASAGIPTMGQTEFSLFLAGSESTDKEIGTKADRIRRSQVRTVILSFVVGALSSFGASFLPPYIKALFAYINVWGTLALLLLTGIGLYIFRARARLVYGSFEFGFGFFLAAKTFWPKFDYTSLTPTDYLQIVASLYIMVRGLDNVQKGLKGTFLESLMERIAPSS